MVISAAHKLNRASKVLLCILHFFFVVFIAEKMEELKSIKNIDREHVFDEGTIVA